MPSAASTWGTRRVELAEEALAMFYEAADAIRYMRNPASLGIETEHIERADGDTEGSSGRLSPADTSRSCSHREDLPLLPATRTPNRGHRHVVILHAVNY